MEEWISEYDFGF